MRADYYPNVAPEDLDPARRRERVCARLAASPADVLCLQEVEEAAFVVFDQALADHVGRYAGRRGKPDGSAIFVRQPTWRIEEEDVVELDGQSGHLAHTLVLAGEGLPRLAVTNTHLKWDEPSQPAGAHRGCQQARRLLEARPAGPWVLTGDLNATPSEPLLQILRGAGLRSAHPDAPPTCNAHGRLRCLDHLLYDGTLEGTPIAPGALLATTPMPSAEHPSDHLPLSATFGWNG